MTQLLLGLGKEKSALYYGQYVEWKYNAIIYFLVQKVCMAAREKSMSAKITLKSL